MIGWACKLPPYVLSVAFSRIHGKCHLCKNPSHHQGWLDFDGLICQGCRQQIPDLGILRLDDMPIFVSTYYDVPYDDVMSAYKDHERLNALMVLYHLLSRIAMPKGLTDAVIIPTPTTPERLLMRGFNPVMVLAKCLSYLWKIPIWQGLHRHDNAIHQRGLDKSARLDNVKDDFYLSEPIGCRQVILFDDVITTGATMKAMAGVIRTHHPKVKIIGVGVLHGKPKLHLPHW